MGKAIIDFIVNGFLIIVGIIILVMIIKFIKELFGVYKYRKNLPEMLEKERKQKEESKRYDDLFKNDWNDPKVYNQDYDQPQIVTGDHYRYKFMGEHDGFAYQRCANAGTAACVNCARRDESSYSGKYRYGMGRDCKDREMVFPDYL